MTVSSKLKKIRTWILLLMISMFPVLSGCGPFPDNVRVVLTTGLSEEQVFRINSMICTKSEYMVYLTNLQKRYEQVYGTEIWDTRLPSSTMEEEVKESVLEKGSTLREITIPPHTMVIMVRRGEDFFVPTGASELKPGDQLLVISDKDAQATYQQMIDDAEEEAQWKAEMRERARERFNRLTAWIPKKK